MDIIARNRIRTPGVKAYATGMVEPGSGHPWWYVFQMAHQYCQPSFKCVRDSFIGHQIMFMARGRGHGSYQDVKWEAGPGTAVLMDLNRKHTYFTDPNDPWDMYWIILEGPGIAKVFNTLIDAAGSPVLPCPRMDQVKTSFRQLFRTLKEQKPGHEGRVAQECTALLALLNESLRTSQSSLQPDDARGAAPSGIAEAQRFMRHHHQHTLSLEQCARAAHMSPFHFIRRFKQATGFTPMEYLEKFRIGRAQEMMAEQPGLRLNEIARAVGFSDPAYFSRIFRKSLGSSPREFRKGLLR